MNATKTRLPLHIFEKMVASLGPADLVKIPPEQLPLYIPSDFIKRVPDRAVKAVEGLLFEAESHRMSQRMEAESQFGKAVAAALDVASHGGSAVLTGIFPKKFEEASLKHQQNVKEEKLNKLMSHLETLSEQIFHDAQDIVSAIDVLATVKEEDSDIKVYMHECYDSLLLTLKNLHHSMDQYALFKLKVLGPKLKQLGERATSAAKELVQLKKGIPETERHIKSLVKSQNIKKEQMATHPEIQALQQQLVVLKARKETLEVLVSKDDLYKNLDLIVHGVLIEKDATKKIATYCYQLWGGVRELVIDYTRSALPIEQYDAVPEQAKQFVTEYFSAKKQYILDTAGVYLPKKTARLEALANKILSTF